MAAPSWNDLYDLGMFTAQVRRPTIVVYEGDASDAMLAGCASMGAAVIGEGARDVRGTFLDGNEGDPLTAEARDRGVERDPAQKSIGQVTFTKSPAPGAGTIPTGFRISTQPAADGSFTSYVTTAPAVFTGANTSATVAAAAEIAGPDSDVDVNTVTRLLDTAYVSGFSVTNAQRFVGGDNEQADEDLIDETRNFWQTQRRATEDALIFGAKQIAEVKRASVLVDASAVITLYVSDADGNSNAAMVDAVEVEIEKWRAAGDIVNVVGASLFLQALDFTLTMRAGVSAAPFLDKIRAAVVSRLGRLVPGETFYRNIATAAAMAVDPQRIYIQSARLNNPVVDIAPTAGQVIRTTTDLITFS